MAATEYSVEVKITDRGALRCRFEDENGEECQLHIDHDGGFSDHEVGPLLRRVPRKLRRMKPGENLAGWLVKGCDDPADDGIWVEEGTFR